MPIFLKCVQKTKQDKTLSFFNEVSKAQTDNTRMENYRPISR